MSNSDSTSNMKPEFPFKNTKEDGNIRESVEELITGVEGLGRTSTDANDMPVESRSMNDHTNNANSASNINDPMEAEGDLQPEEVEEKFKENYKARVKEMRENHSFGFGPAFSWDIELELELPSELLGTDDWTSEQQPTNCFGRSMIYPYEEIRSEIKELEGKVLELHDLIDNLKH